MTSLKLIDQLHPEALRQLRKYIKLIITDARLTVYHGKLLDNYIDFPNEHFYHLAKLFLPKAHFLNIIDLRYLLSAWLYDSTVEMKFSDPKTVAEIHQFTSFLPAIKLQNLEDLILDKLISLPNEYTILVPIMHRDYVGDILFPDNVEISEGISLFVMSENQRSIEFPIIGSFNDPEMPGEYHPPTNHLYLSIKTFGCQNFSPDSFLYNAFIKKLNLVLSALIANKIILINWSNNLNYFGDGSSSWDQLGYPSNIWGPGYAYVYPQITSEKPILCLLQDPQKTLLRSLYFSSDNNISEFEEKKRKKQNAERAFTKELSGKIYNIKKLFSLQNLEVNRVITALQWYFFGLLNDNRTFSYIQFAIALEALFGDPKSRSNIVDRLSDRCSYVLATASADRGIIKKEIEEIYDIRSQIVHTGNIKLQDKYTDYYTKLKRYIEQSIMKEMDILS